MHGSTAATANSRLFGTKQDPLHLFLLCNRPSFSTDAFAPLPTLFALFPLPPRFPPFSPPLPPFLPTSLAFFSVSLPRALSLFRTPSFSPRLSIVLPLCLSLSLYPPPLLSHYLPLIPLSISPTPSRLFSPLLFPRSLCQPSEPDVRSDIVAMLRGASMSKDKDQLTLAIKKAEEAGLHFEANQGRRQLSRITG